MEHVQQVINYSFSIAASKYAVKNNHVIPDSQEEASSTDDMLGPIHNTEHHYIERTILIVLLSILPVATLVCLFCLCLVLCMSKGRKRQKKKRNKEEYELERYFKY